MLNIGLDDNKKIQGDNPQLDVDSRLEGLSEQEILRIADIYMQRGQLIISALIHHSYIVPKMKYLSSNIYLNKKLKFLGCASLKMLIAEFLYKNNRNMNEGKMTSLRGRILSRTSFQRVAKNMELDKWLLVGNHNEKGIGNSMLVDGFEALIGAIYLDGGLEQVKEFVLEVMKDEIDDAFKKFQKNMNREGD